MVAVLSEAELAERATNLRVLFSDVDGVLTDGSAYYSAAGEVLKCFNMRDGMGVALLAEHGIRTAFITREASAIAQRRGEKLGLEWVFTGIADKRQHLVAWAAEHGFSLRQIAYIGDDVNDLPALRLLAETSLTAAPSDALPGVREVVHRITNRPGGRGAFREFADFIVELRTKRRLHDDR